MYISVCVSSDAEYCCILYMILVSSDVLPPWPQLRTKRKTRSTRVNGQSSLLVVRHGYRSASSEQVQVSTVYEKGYKTRGKFASLHSVRLTY